MNVLSLFDGMSCGRLALDRAEIKIKNYYASEIDKYAITVAQANYPDTIQLGCVKEIDLKKLPKFDLLIGGSPCQGFSFAGKQLNFNNPRSKLFFEYARLLKALKPRYFLLENVKMKKEFQDIISKALGVQPVEINSALVSAQNRKRLYWTNIPGVTQPPDKFIYLKDIIEWGVVDRDKSYCIDANYVKGGNPKAYFEYGKRQLVFIHQRGRGYNKGGIKALDGKVPTLTSSGYEHNNHLILVGRATDIKGHDLMKRIYSIEGKSPTLNSMSGGNREPKIALKDLTYRKLTTIECERLQTVPDNYTNHVSNSQRYKMLGNGWTIDVLAHIFKGLK